jgi:hypothetical protein
MSIVSLAALDAPASAERPSTTGLQVSWVTVAAFAIAIAYVDGFCVTSLHGAIGSVDSTESPFVHWLRDSTLMMPPLVLAVLAALGLARRWVGHNRREIARLAGAALLVILFSSAASIAEVAISSASDYRVQANQLEQVHSIHATTVAVQPGTVGESSPGSCTSLCAARHETVVTQLRGVGVATVVLLITNLVLVLWVLALRGGRVWTPGKSRRANAGAR